MRVERAEPGAPREMRLSIAAEFVGASLLATLSGRVASKFAPTVKAEPRKPPRYLTQSTGWRMG